MRAAIKNVELGQDGAGRLDADDAADPHALHRHPERNFKRKIREAKLAEELENARARKDWILTKYLNTVPYGTDGGQTAVGVQAAARVFFNKPVDELTLAEAALLAGLPQAPVALQPVPRPGGRDAAPQRGAAHDGRRWA